MASRFVAPSAWLVAFVLAGCAGPGKLTIYSEGNTLDNAAELLRDASAPPADIGRELDKRPAEEYRVEPGDVLLVQTISMGASLRLPGDQTVLPDGTIRLGPLGTLQVMNQTVNEIQKAIDDRIRALTPMLSLSEKEDRVIVRLVTRDSKVFYVLGEVNAPGSFQLKGRETVLDALMTAGGLNTNGSRNNIILVRPTPPDSCRVVLPVDFRAIVQCGDPTTNYQIRAGDRVYVPCKGTFEDLLHLFCRKDRYLTNPPCYPHQPGPVCTTGKAFPVAEPGR